MHLLRSIPPLLLALALAPSAAGQCELRKFTGNGSAASDQLGSSRRSLALVGEVLLAGVPGDDTLGSDAGAVRVYQPKSIGTFQQFRLLASDGVAFDRFGEAVAAIGEGPTGTAVIGACNHSGVLGVRAGAAYVFERVGSGFLQIQKLEPTNGGPGDEFGRAVALAGQLLAVGAPLDDVGGLNAGAVYVFQRAGATYKPIGVLRAPLARSGDQFGAAVAFAGEALAIGAPGRGALDEGAVHIFERVVADGPFLQTQVLLASDARANDFLGGALTANEGTIVAGALTDDAGTDSGAAYVFERAGAAGQYQELQKLVASDGSMLDRFGASLAITRKGETLVVGASTDDTLAGVNTGSAYAFTRGPTAVGPGGISGVAFKQLDRLAPADAAGDDQFGRSVAIVGDRVAASAPLDDDSAPDGGAVYAFLLDLGQELFACPLEVSLSKGGVQTFELSAPGQALQLYLLLGSASGTGPGVPISPIDVLPLVPDAYFNITLSNPNSPPLSNSLSALDFNGQATATFSLKANTTPTLVGVVANHAFIVLKPNAIVLASNAVSVELVP